MYRWRTIYRLYSSNKIERKTARRGQLLILTSIFGIGLAGVTISNYYNTDIDVVYSDSDLMNYIVKRVPSIRQVYIIYY